ncbi:MAG: hypothetical protein EP307_00665 [Rhodobacteraceae bacterium]|nr:MAG: hypothetical protein EP307_00665 [Paracoccaceae bacterium]
MAEVEADGQGGFVVEAGTLARAFDLAPDQVRPLMQGGAITSRCEKGEGEDAGRWRLTFYHGDRAFRLVVDDAGTVLSRARFDAPRRG